MTREQALRRLSEQQAAGVFAAERLHPLVQNYYLTFEPRLRLRIEQQRRRWAEFQRNKLALI